MKMLFVFTTMLAVIFRWIYLASGHRCILNVVFQYILQYKNHSFVMYYLQHHYFMAGDKRRRSYPKLFGTENKLPLSNV